MKTIKELEKEIEEDIEIGFNVEKYGETNPDIPNECYERIAELQTLKEVLKLIIKMIESDDMKLGSAKKQQCKRCGAYYGINYYEDCTCGCSDFEEYVCIDKRLILNKLKQKIGGKK